MAENPENPPEGRFEEGSSEPDPGNFEDLIELSDIAVGTSDEDEEIIELTEEVVDEAMGAISNARGTGDGEEELDLSEDGELFGDKDQADAERTEDSGWLSPDSSDEESLADVSAAEVEDFLDQELDEYFGEDETEASESLSEPLNSDSTPDQPPAAPEIPVSPEMLDAALERVVRNLYGKRVEEIIKDMINERVAIEMARLRKNMPDASDI